MLVSEETNTTDGSKTLLIKSRETEKKYSGVERKEEKRRERRTQV